MNTKKILCLIFILCCLLGSAFAQEDINEYTPVLIKSISWGTGEGEIGMEPGMGPNHPSSPFVSPFTGDVYISDTKSGRVNIYNSSMEYIGEVAVNQNIKYAPYIKVDSLGNLYGFAANTFEKALRDGSVVYYYNLKRKSDILSNKYWVHEGYVLFYDDSVPLMLDLKGNRLAEESIIEFRDRELKDSILFKSDFRYSKAWDEITTYLKDENIMFAGDEIISRDFEVYKYIWGILGLYNAYQEITEEKVIYFGKDKEYNTYWYAKNRGSKGSYLVFDKYGKLLDRFFFKSQADTSAITPDGDLFMMQYHDYENKQFNFYTIKRVW